MPTYILLTKLSPESLGEPKQREQVGRQWFEAVKTAYQILVLCHFSQQLLWS